MLLAQDHSRGRERTTTNKLKQGKKAGELVTQNRLHKATAAILSNMLPSTSSGLLAE